MTDTIRKHSLVYYCILCTLISLFCLCHLALLLCLFFFFSSRRRHTRLQGDWSSDVCSSDLLLFDDFGSATGGAVFYISQPDRKLSFGVHEGSLGRRSGNRRSSAGTPHFGQGIGRASCRERV